MNNETQITCPNCKTQIDVNDILKHQIEDNIRKEFQEKELQSKKILKDLEDKLVNDKANFETQKKKQTEEFQDMLDSKLEKELKTKEEKLKSKLEKENSALRSEIDRINNDIDYFEDLARKKGLVKENEIIFDFSKTGHWNVAGAFDLF